MVVARLNNWLRSRLLLQNMGAMVRYGEEMRRSKSGPFDALALPLNFTAPWYRSEHFIRTIVWSWSHLYGVECALNVNGSLLLLLLLLLLLHIPARPSAALS